MVELPTDGSWPILLKNSTQKIGRGNDGREKAISLQFLSPMTFDRTLVVKCSAKFGTFLTTKHRAGVFQQNRPVAGSRLRRPTYPASLAGSARDGGQQGMGRELATMGSAVVGRSKFRWRRMSFAVPKLCVHTPCFGTSPKPCSLLS